MTPTPGWLKRHPLLWARGLAARNSIDRFTQARRRVAMFTVAVLVAGLLCAYAAIAAARSGTLNILGPALAYWPLVALLAIVHALMTVSRRLRRYDDEASRSWLAAAPVRATSVRLTRTLVAIISVLVQWFAVSVLIIVISAVDAADAAVAGKLIAALSAGAAGGSLIGLWMPKPKARMQYEGSRYGGGARAGESQPIQPSDAALSRWPISLTLAWSRPENSRVLLVIALLSVQAGSSMLGGLAVVAMWGVAAYLSSLLAAVVQVAREASVWLRSTPISLHAFALPIVRRALLHQLLGTVVAMAVMKVLGSPLSMALALGAMWMSIVVLVCATSLVVSSRRMQS